MKPDPIQCVCTFDSANWASYGPEYSVLPSHYPCHTKVTMEHNSDSIVRPNLVQKASETYLAECLRKNHPRYKKTLSRAQLTFLSGFDLRRARSFKRDDKRIADIAIERRLPSTSNAKKIPWLQGRLLGIEIEYYPQADLGDNHNLSALTYIGTDGSLGSGGRELRKISWQDHNGKLPSIARLPLQGKADEKCGLHVHVDVRHAPESVAGNAYDNLCWHYPYLQRLVAPSRLASTFCHWQNNRANGAFFSLHSRYCAANFHSYTKHGTIEFRCHEGTVDPVEIETWALFVQWLTNYCMVNDYVAPNWSTFLSLVPYRFRSWARNRYKSFYSTNPPDVPTVSRSDFSADSDAPAGVSSHDERILRERRHHALALLRAWDYVVPANGWRMEHIRPFIPQRQQAHAEAIVAMATDILREMHNADRCHAQNVNTYYSPTVPEQDNEACA